MKTQHPVYKRFTPVFLPALIMIMALLTVFFFIGGPGYHSPRSFKYFWNLGHLLYYALLPLLLFSSSTGKRPDYVLQLIIIFGITVLLGTLVELLQGKFSRSVDLGDIFRNLIGACVAICFLLPIRRIFPQTRLIIFRAILVILILLQFFPIGVSLLDEYRARRDFPILSDFQSSLQIDRWTGNAAITIEEIGPQNNRAMRADLTTQLYSGVALQYFPINWQQYQWLQFRIYNPSTEDLAITCRIHDKKHSEGERKYQDRFNNSYVISQGWNTISISLKEVEMAADKRKIDLSQIYGVGIFTSRLGHPRTIYIDDVRLLKS